jgi:hypothetical protein
MLRKVVIALLAVVAIGMSPTVASARGGFGGFHGGFGGGGWHGGGWRGGGWGGGWRGPAYGAIGLGVGLGLAGAYAGYGYPYGYGYGGPYGYDDDYGYASYGGGCYVVRHRVATPYGWRFRPVQVCD